MAREAKFNFEEERHLVDMSRVQSLAKHTVSVNGKYGTLQFSLEYIRDRNLDGAFIKLYADPVKKVIGWKTLREHNTEDLQGYRKLSIYTGKAGKYSISHCKLSVGKLLKALKVPERTLGKLPIKKYESGILDGEISYIEL